MAICLSTSPSCHTAMQWHNLMKVQDLTGEELSQASSALVLLCDSFAKCKLIVAVGVFCPSHLLLEQEAGAPEPWQVGLVEEWDLPVWVC